MGFKCMVWVCCECVWLWFAHGCNVVPAAVCQGPSSKWAWLCPASEVPAFIDWSILFLAICFQVTVSQTPVGMEGPALKKGTTQGAFAYQATEEMLVRSVSRTTESAARYMFEPTRCPPTTCLWTLPRGLRSLTGVMCLP